MDIIAHRGASAYLPEHTLPAKALAHGMGAHYLEQDVVASRDSQLVVLHDIHLDRVSDVAERFPDRARDDGRFYAIDFTLDEMKMLMISERRNEDGTPVYPERFPIDTRLLRIHTLEEELDFIRGLNRSTRREAGIYPEIKKPAWHKEQGVDITPLMLEVLEKYEYTDVDDPIYLQCFDPDEVMRIRNELKSNLKLVQLIADDSWNESPANYDAMINGDVLEALLPVVDGFGPWISHLYELDEGGKPVATSFARRLRDSGKACHPYTLRADALQEGFRDSAAVLHFLQAEAGANGIFTDHPDVAIRSIKAAKELF